MAHEIENLWRVEDHLSGSAAAVSRQVGLLKRYGAFEAFNKLNTLSIPENPFEKGVLIVSDPLRMEERDILISRIDVHSPASQIEFMKRKKHFPTMILLYLAYNIGIPRRTPQGEITENAYDEISLCSDPRGMAVAHKTYLEGMKFYSEEVLFSDYSEEQVQERVMSASLTFLRDNPPL